MEYEYQMQQKRKQTAIDRLFQQQETIKSDQCFAMRLQREQRIKAQEKEIAKKMQ